MSDPVSELESQNMHSTGAADHGFASLGTALGDHIGGGAQLKGELAYDNGMRIGASTMDALAQARDRVQKSRAAMSAAQALRNPELQAQLGQTPEQAEYLASMAEYGAQPEQITQAGLQFQKARGLHTLGDQFASPGARHAALAQVDPGSQTIHAEGTGGNFIDPLGYNPDQPINDKTNSPIHMGAEQHQLNVAEINRREATATNQDAHATAAGMPALKHGYEWVFNRDGDPTSGVLTGADGQGVQRPSALTNPGEGQVNERNTRRVNNASNALAAETKILGKIGFDASTGAQGVGNFHGLLGVASENLGKALSSEQSQNYRSSLAGVSQQLGVLELVGGVPPGSYTAQLERAIKNDVADTPETRLQHAALIRQIVEVAAQSAEDNPKMAPAYRKGIIRAAQQVQKNIPFTASEVQDFRANHKPGQSFQQYLDSNKREEAEQFGDGGGGAAAPVQSAPQAAPSQNDPIGIRR